MASTYEEILAKSRELAAAGDMAGAKRLAQIAVARRDAGLSTPAVADGALSPQQQDTLANLKAGKLTVSPDAAATQNAYDTANMGPLNDAANPPMGRMDALGRGALQGLTFGFGDEAVAAIRPWLHSGETYDSALTDQRAGLDKARTDHPGYAYGGEIAGSIAPGALAGGAWAAGAKNLPGMFGRGAAVGAGQGAAYGFGAGEGGLASRVGSAAAGAVVGGALGGGLPVVGKALQIGARVVANPTMSALNIASPTAASRGVAKALARSGKSADEIQAMIDAAGREGQLAFTMADALGPSGQSILSGAARTPGAAKQEVVDFLLKRQDGQAKRLGGFVADALEAPDTAAQRTAALTRARSDAADIAYGAIRADGTTSVPRGTGVSVGLPGQRGTTISTATRGSGPVDVRDALGVIDSRIGGMQGSGITGDGIDATLAKYRGRLAAPDRKLPDGVSSFELSDFNRVLGVKQDLNDEIGAALRSGQKNRARELGKLHSALDAALEGASPAYRQANDQFAAASRVIDQIDAGKAATSIRSRAADTTDAFTALTPEQQAAFRSGYSDPVLAKIENAAPGVNKARPILNDGTMQDLGMMAKDPSLLARQVGREHTMFETSARALGGSKTADNLGDIADVQGLDIPLLLNLFTRPKTAAIQFVGKAASAIDGRGEATRALLAKALLSHDVQAALAPAAKASTAANGRIGIISTLLRQAGVSLPQAATQK